MRDTVCHSIALRSSVHSLCCGLCGLSGVVCSCYCQATFAASALSAPNRRLKMHEIFSSLRGFQQPSQPSQSPPSPLSLCLFLLSTSLVSPLAAPSSQLPYSDKLQKCSNFHCDCGAFCLFSAVAAVSQHPKLQKCSNFCLQGVCHCLRSRRRIPISQKCTYFTCHCACRFSRHSLSVTLSLCHSVTMSLSLSI